MITLLRRTYQLTVTIKAPATRDTGFAFPSTVVNSFSTPPHSFWDGVKETGCDDVVAKVRAVLAQNGFGPGDCDVRLESFRHEP